LGDLKKKSKKVASGDKVVEIIAEKVDDNELKNHQEVAEEARKEDKVVDGKISKKRIASEEKEVVTSKKKKFLPIC